MLSLLFHAISVHPQHRTSTSPAFRQTLRLISPLFLPSRGPSILSLKLFLPCRCLSPILLQLISLMLRWDYEVMKTGRACVCLHYNSVRQTHPVTLSRDTPTDGWRGEIVKKLVRERKRVMRHEERTEDGMETK